MLHSLNPSLPLGMPSGSGCLPRRMTGLCLLSFDLCLFAPTSGYRRNGLGRLLFFAAFVLLILCECVYGLNMHGKNNESLVRNNNKYLESKDTNAIKVGKFGFSNPKTLFIKTIYQNSQCQMESGKASYRFTLEVL